MNLEIIPLFKKIQGEHKRGKKAITYLISGRFKARFGKLLSPDDGLSDILSVVRVSSGELFRTLAKTSGGLHSTTSKQGLGAGGEILSGKKNNVN